MTRQAGPPTSAPDARAALADPAAPDVHAALYDLDALVLEVGASYPLLSYVPTEEDEPEEEALEPLIFAGLVSP